LKGIRGHDFPDLTLDVIPLHRDPEFLGNADRKAEMPSDGIGAFVYNEKTVSDAVLFLDDFLDFSVLLDPISFFHPECPSKKQKAPRK